ncbi:flagellar basal body rod protein FlgG [Bacillus dakarensis]|uniref:flagellar basal body rod protein FlgG n=1 Tax=Robertmurraya dakarensis TaxID=1926278 RepID=UPI000980DCD4|nr:flagellar basal body rod protein FlgG [Bacillus dakarensis]
MLRSMYSGINGMKNFQTKLDVIGNNIANVNTFGFKKGRVVFKEMISQTISGATGNVDRGDGAGGVNPKQVGLGSQIAAIDTIDTEGSTQTTGRVLDLAISGDGYFAVRRGNADDGEMLFTRAGNLYLDNQGYLVTSAGDYILDEESGAIQINGGATDEIANLSIGTDGTITYIVDGAPEETSPIGIARFRNNAGLEKAGENLYRNTANASEDVEDEVELLAPGVDGAGKIVSGALEMSNVDLSEEFTEMIVAQRGFQANTKIITTSDEILQELVNLKR